MSAKRSSGIRSGPLGRWHESFQFFGKLTLLEVLGQKGEKITPCIIISVKYDCSGCASKAGLPIALCGVHKPCLRKVVVGLFRAAHIVLSVQHL